MNANQFDSSAILNLLTAIAALAAVILAVLTDRRGEKIAAANVKPLLSVSIERSGETWEVLLSNEGLGTATKINVSFTKGELHSTTNICDVLEIDSLKPCVRNFYFLDTEHIHLRTGSSFMLLGANRARLLEANHSADFINGLFAQLDEKIQGVVIRANCKDVLGNKQKEYRVTCQVPV